MPLTIVHLVPYDGIGGTETAARSMVVVEEPDLHFRVQYLAPHHGPKSPPPSLDVVVLYRALRVLLQQSPSLWIASLWRSAIVGTAAKLLRPRGKFVLFLHSSRHVHWADALATRMAGLLADEIWADSQQTLLERLPQRGMRKGRVVSFLVHRISPAPAKPVRPSFIFWGRLAPEKQLDRALRIFAQVRGCYPAATFQVIGPDGGELRRLRATARELGVDAAVHFCEPTDFAQIAGRAGESSFYLQTSSFEGMGLSVVEAMQLGLVPVITPVGEIGRYCRDGLNSVVIDDDERAAAAISALLQDDDSYQRTRANAIACWSASDLYRDAVLAACREILTSRLTPAAKEASYE